MSKHAEEIVKALDIMRMTCEEIQEKKDGCMECPLRKYLSCLDDTSPLDLAEDLTATKWQEFMDYADEEEKATLTEKEEYELLMDEWYSRLPQREVNVYGHNITIIG